jgi:hypothetical protein
MMKMRRMSADDSLKKSEENSSKNAPAKDRKR